jgi:hypothetical protein
MAETTPSARTIKETKQPSTSAQPYDIKGDKKKDEGMNAVSVDT